MFGPFTEDITRFLFKFIAALGIFALFPMTASAIPLYARQMGVHCDACHTAFPELNAFGRQFKLLGYTQGTRQKIPLAVMAQFSVNRIRDNNTNQTPYPKNGDLLFEGGSLFTGGKITDNFGAFVQWSYSNIEGDNNDTGHSSIDNVDIRYADQVNKPDSKIIYGLSLHNAPTVQDVWNTVPAWGYPFQSPKVAAPGYGPDSTFLESGPRVAGMGGYVFLNNLFYAELTGYRTADQMFSILRAGNTSDPIADRTTLKGYNPYWRFALNKDWGNHSAMIGYYGIDAHQYADFTQTGLPTTKYLDQAVDAQYQYIGDTHLFTAQLNYIHEKRNYNYDFSPGVTSGHDNQMATLNSFKTKATYYYKKTYGGSIGYFSTTGDKDVTAYGSESANGKPDTSGIIYELSYQPIENIRLTAQYTDYRKFNGSSTNYDTGAPGGRNATDNNTFYLYGWLAY